tara:strand:- start:741 stop:1157 length:417 start_codon:yes stop_codon:yes gene_type:complete
MLARGLIIDRVSEQPLPRANVIITDKSGKVINEDKKVASDEEGIFTIEVFPSDYLTISYIGYKNKIVSIQDFSSDVVVVPMMYLKHKEGNVFSNASGLLKDENEAHDGALTNKPVKWYYWVALGLLGYYAVKKLKIIK